MKKIIFTILLAVLALGPIYSQVNLGLDYQSKFAIMELTPQEYNTWITEDGFSNDAIRQTMTKRIYNKFNDDFDFIFFISNEQSRPTTIPYYGKFAGIANNTLGIGRSIYSSSSNYGSSGKLQGIMHIPYRSGLMYGPTLHEFMHNWGNYALQTGIYDPASGPDNNFDGHWGFTGGSSPGQLGGFDQSTLKTNINGDPNRYSVKQFGVNVNGGNSQPYSKLELYLMGMIPASEVPTFDLFRDITSVTPVGETFEFVAGTRETYNGSSLVAKLGARTPDYLSSQKDFKVLFVLISNTPLNETEWMDISDQVTWFAGNTNDDKSIYNFYEATEGKGTINISNLASSLKLNTSGNITLNSPPSSVKFGIATNITWQTNISGNVKIELFQNGVLKETLTSNVEASSKTFSWTPTESMLGDLYRLKITSLSDPSVYDFTDNIFKIDYQYYKISGTITDETGKPLANAILKLGETIVPDQAQTEDNFTISLSLAPKKQSFKPSGDFLGKIDLMLNKSAGSTKDVYVEITDNTGTVIGRDTIPNAEIKSKSSFVSASFFPIIKVSPEKEYTILVSADDSEISWSLGYPSAYTRGESDIVENADYTFITYKGNGTELKPDESGYYECWINAGYSGELSLASLNTLYQPSPSKVLTSVANNLSNQDFVLYSPVKVSGYVYSTNNIPLTNTTVNWGEPLTVDQSQTSTKIGYGIRKEYELSQTFIPTANTLSQVQLALIKNGTPTQTINVQIKKENEIIGTQTIVPSSISKATNWVSAPFIPALNLIPGQEYTISVTASGSGEYYWFCDSAKYNNGTAIGIDKTNYDFSFITNQGNGGQFLTDASGYYEFRYPRGWNGVIQASKAGYTFFPIQFSNLTTSLTEQNFKDGINTSINNIEEAEAKVKIYPNPASDLIFIESGSADDLILSVEILNEKGESLKTLSESFTGTKSYSISEVSSGLYFLKISNSKGVRIHKLTKL